MNELPDPDADRDFRTYIPDWLWAEYFSALGRLMHSFARVEDNLNLTLALMAEELVFPPKYYMPPIAESERLTAQAMLKGQREASLSIQRRAVLQAIVAGQRVAPLRDTIKRLLRVIGAEDSMRIEVDRILAHLSEIQFMRDRLAHNAAVPDMRNKEGWFGTSNQHTVRENEQWEIIYFKPAMLSDMARDLDVMPDLLYDCLHPEEHKLLMADPHYNKLMSSSEMQTFLADRNGPWHYKPSQLRREGPKWHAKNHQDGRS